MKKILSSTPILAIMCCLLWSIIFVPTKVGLTYFEYPFQYAGYTHLIAGLLLFPWGGFGREYIKHVNMVGFKSGVFLYYTFIWGVLSRAEPYRSITSSSYSECPTVFCVCDGTFYDEK